MQIVAIKAVHYFIQALVDEVPPREMDLIFIKLIELGQSSDKVFTYLLIHCCVGNLA